MELRHFTESIKVHVICLCFLSQFGTGSGNGPYYYPYAAAIDPTSHNIVVVESYNRRVQIFAPNNRPPLASAGPNQTVQCSSPSGASVLLNGSTSSDPDGDPLSFAWSGPFGAATGVAPTVTVPLGTNTINLTVSDGKGGTGSASMSATVQDATPPLATLTLTPNVLWPPNHKLVPITATLQVSDQCDRKPLVSLVSITSNQPDSGLDIDDVPGDIQGATFGTDDRTFLLRAERVGIPANGLTDAQVKLGRTYTITYRVFDKSGNATTVSGKVTVPHSQ